MNEYHREILAGSVEQREREVTEYQVNIDNYTRAIAKIGDDVQMQPFAEQLRGLLESSRYEQRKAQIMLDVIKEQLCDS